MESIGNMTTGNPPPKKKASSSLPTGYIKGWKQWSFDIMVSRSLLDSNGVGAPRNITGGNPGPGRDLQTIRRAREWGPGCHCITAKPWMCKSMRSRRGRNGRPGPLVGAHGGACSSRLAAGVSIHGSIIHVEARCCFIID